MCTKLISELEIDELKPINLKELGRWKREILKGIVPVIRVRGKSVIKEDYSKVKALRSLAINEVETIDLD